MGTANYNLDLTGEWEFHLGALPKKEKLSNNDYHIMAEAGGALYEYELDAEGLWDKVTVPHDWLTHLPYDSGESAMNGYKARGIAYYRRKITLDESEIESARLTFDGILGISTVYVNGTVAARNFSGYNRFSAEIGDYLLSDEENTVIVEVDASRGEGWFYEGAGIYRAARIEFRCLSRLLPEDSFVYAQENDGKWTLFANIGACLTGEGERTLKLSLFSPDGESVGGSEITANESAAVTMDIESPVLWSPDSPFLYTLNVALFDRGEKLDEFFLKTGLRKIEFSLDKGMLLNGVPTRVKGICCHQDHAGVGAAVTDEINEYRIKRLKSLGVNAYRTAHHAVTEDFLSICDRLGILVMVENRTFSTSENALTELESMVKTSRNHPSVFLYSLFNEEPWQNDLRGYRIAKKMRERILLLDKTRKVTAAQNSGILEKHNASDALDIIGVNYNLKNYEECHRRTPEKLILGTENCPTFATRGIYETDKEKCQFSSYGDDYADWFSESIDETMEAVEKYPFVIGAFAWCGFEHRGEPVPCAWPSVTSHWGFYDSCGFPKDTAFLLRAYYSDELRVHLTPRRMLKVGEEVRVLAFTNAEEAELFLDGNSLGTLKVKRRRAEWRIKYTGGALKVVARRDGKVCEDEISPSSLPTKLVIEDKTRDKKNPSSRVINVKILDNMGALVYNFNEKIEISLFKGKILGVGNGNPISHHDEKADSVFAFCGKAQIIVTGDTEKMSLKAGELSCEIKF